MSGKKFNTTGICIPSLHYMVDTTDMIDQIIDGYIEQGEYFTINRARQFGKTTTLELLYQRLKETYIGGGRVFSDIRDTCQRIDHGYLGAVKGTASSKAFV